MTARHQGEIWLIHRQGNSPFSGHCVSWTGCPQTSYLLRPVLFQFPTRSECPTRVLNSLTVSLSICTNHPCKTFRMLNDRPALASVSLFSRFLALITRMMEINGTTYLIQKFWSWNPSEAHKTFGWKILGNLIFRSVQKLYHEISRNGPEFSTIDP